MSPVWSGEAGVFGEDHGAGVEEIDDGHGGEHVGFVVKYGVEGISYCPSGGKRRACAFPLRRSSSASIARMAVPGGNAA